MTWLWEFLSISENKLTNLESLNSEIDTLSFKLTASLKLLNITKLKLTKLFYLNLDKNGVT